MVGHLLVTEEMARNLQKQGLPQPLRLVHVKKVGMARVKKETEKPLPKSIKIKKITPLREPRRGVFYERRCSRILRLAAASARSSNS